MSTDFTKPWMHTYTGRAVNFLDLRPEDIDIEDIAHALSMQCRFNGHTKWFYSVAEHCVHVSREVDQAFAFEALLHDASEAYIGDMISPIKTISPAFKDIENKVEGAINRRFQISSYYPLQATEVKRADLAMCIKEGRTLLADQTLVDMWSFAKDARYATTREEHTLYCWPPAVAKAEFLNLFYELLDKRGV